MFSKLVNFWVNKAVTETLLSSPKFHEFAAKTHHHVNNISKTGMEYNHGLGEPAPLINEGTNRASVFAKAFKETIIKESENIAKKK
ncbi:hypothetical protein BGZ80_009963 [Entomortierella chlamydospora]|uniref:Uncharacterized protein n=1 Tax=Entomortierella chlamydospora TaxID=101097 RepID=A0A9P6MW23_9FUNG|nr:hypothetical protein BGZ79_009876 [Entomortierella chlamydospora]KAG0015238.1 hypothetical protein BGZ80_009963 [Entomortierella chlamydospora]